MAIDDIRLAIQAAKLLGRWSRVAERHANGCACCPGLGEVTMDEVEAGVAAWLRERHACLRDESSFTALLKRCIQRAGPRDALALAPLFLDLEEALSELERVQDGF